MQDRRNPRRTRSPSPIIISPSSHSRRSSRNEGADGCGPHSLSSWPVRERAPSPIHGRSPTHTLEDRAEAEADLLDCNAPSEHELQSEPIANTVLTDGTATMRNLDIPMRNFAAAAGKDGKNFARLEEVHGVKIKLLPVKEGALSQEICITEDSFDGRHGPSRCGDAANEIAKLLEFNELFGLT